MSLWTGKLSNPVGFWLFLRGTKAYHNLITMRDVGNGT
jgi:hypothetical protein